MNWQEANEWEKNWWSDCCDTTEEEIKQRVYAKKMGLITRNLEGKSILDVGGGAVSLLLKFKNRGDCAVIDPCKYPDWIASRYLENEIVYYVKKAEDMFFAKNRVFDEAWMYNCLQHTENPEKIVKKMRKYTKIIRVFEWVDQGISPGHIQNLQEDKLNEWLGGKGRVEVINEDGCHGKCYFGVFKGDHYAEI